MSYWRCLELHFKEAEVGLAEEEDDSFVRYNGSQLKR